MKKELLATIAASLLILLFMYTSFSKIFDPREFNSSMSRQPLPAWMIAVLLKTLPGTEIAVSLLLIFSKTRKAGFWASLVMMSAFTTYIALGMLHFFKYVPCSCGGVFKNITWPNHFLFNLIFIGISIVGIVVSRREDYSAPMPNEVKFG